jgi:hypothetical protein
VLAGFPAFKGRKDPGSPRVAQQQDDRRLHRNVLRRPKAERGPMVTGRILECCRRVTASRPPNACSRRNSWV